MHRSLILALAALAAGCSKDYGFAAESGSQAPGDSSGPSSSDDTEPGPPAPETEKDFYALAPAQTDRFVFIANPGRGTVTRVNVETLAVDTTKVGTNPQIVLTTPDYATAAVFNEDDDTVSLIDADTLQTLTVQVRPDLNQMVMSPDGAWVALWHDLSAVDDGDEPDGVIAFNEVSFVEVRTGRHEPLAVGNYPHGIEWTADLAVVVSDESLALVDLDAEPLDRELVPISDDFVDPPAAEEVVLAPDASYAFVRQFGATDLTIVDLGSREVSRVPAGANPTDLDLTPDGRTAVLVARDANELWLYEVEDPFAAPRTVPLSSELVTGSVVLDPTGKTGILYSTAVLQAVYAVWDLETDTITPRSLVKPVQSLSVGPTGDSLLVFHTVDNQPELPSSDTFYDASALTMIDLSDFGKTDVYMPSTLKGWTTASNGEYSYFIMEGEPMLGVLDWGRLMVEEVSLSSTPVFVGALPDLDETDGDDPPAWVSQEHELGRISFYDADDAALTTITGFELNSEIEVQ